MYWTVLLGLLIPQVSSCPSAMPSLAGFGYSWIDSRVLLKEWLNWQPCQRWNSSRTRTWVAYRSQDSCRDTDSSGPCIGLRVESCAVRNQELLSPHSWNRPLSTFGPSEAAHQRGRGNLRRSTIAVYCPETPSTPSLWSSGSNSAQWREWNGMAQSCWCGCRGCDCRLLWIPSSN